MLVKFSLSVANIDAIGADKIETPLSELLRAHRNGFHLLVFERRVAEYLVEKVSLSNQDKAVLRRLHQEFTQNGRLHERATAYIEIVSPGAFVVKNGRCLSVPLNLIDARTFGTPSLLLTEDANSDARLIRFVLHNVLGMFKGPIQFRRRTWRGNLDRRAPTSSFGGKASGDLRP